MKLLITGKNGQLGQELEREAKEKDFEVLSTDRMELDVTDPHAIKSNVLSFKPDVLINATAYNLVPQAEDDYQSAYALNAMAVREMAVSCRENNVKFITYSTDYVFDGKKGSPYTEDDSPNPLQKYGESKLEGEKEALLEYPEGSFVIRTCALFGGKTGSPGKGTNIVLSLLKAAQEKPYIEAVSDQFANPTYARNLCSATFELLEKNANPGIYHLASEGYCNWVEFAKEILKIAQIEKEVKAVASSQFPSKVKKPAFSALANTKAKEMGIVLSSWQEALGSYFEDFDLVDSTKA